MIITVTERGSFRRCKRAWDLASFNRQSLTPILSKPALNLGTLVHATLADWTVNPEADVSDLFVGHSVKMLEDVQEKYRASVGANMSPVELNPFYDVMGLGEQMVVNYVTQWGAPLPGGFTLIQPEQTCLVDIPGVEDNWYCGGCHKRWWVVGDNSMCPRCGQTFPYGTATITRERAQLEGTLDGFVMNAEERMFVLERKTYATKPRLDVLQMTDQFLAYDWILVQLFPEYAIGGILYDGLLKKPGASTNNRSKRTLADCFLRHTFTRTPAEIAEFSTNLAAEYRDMMNTDVAYPNRAWQGCWDCAFEKVCTAMSRGEDLENLLGNYTIRVRGYDTDHDDGETSNDD